MVGHNIIKWYFNISSLQAVPSSHQVASLTWSNFDNWRSLSWQTVRDPVKNWLDISEIIFHQLWSSSELFLREEKLCQMWSNIMWCCDSDYVRRPDWVFYHGIWRQSARQTQRETLRLLPAVQIKYSFWTVSNSPKSWMVLCCEFFLPKSNYISQSVIFGAILKTFFL